MPILAEYVSRRKKWLTTSVDYKLDCSHSSDTKGFTRLILMTNSWRSFNPLTINAKMIENVATFFYYVSNYYLASSQNKRLNIADNFIYFQLDTIYNTCYKLNGFWNVSIIFPTPRRKPDELGRLPSKIYFRGSFQNIGSKSNSTTR